MRALWQMRARRCLRSRSVVGPWWEALYDFNLPVSMSDTINQSPHEKKVQKQQADWAAMGLFPWEIHLLINFCVIRQFNSDPSKCCAWECLSVSWLTVMSVSLFLSPGTVLGVRGSTWWCVTHLGSSWCGSVADLMYGIKTVNESAEAKP